MRGKTEFSATEAIWLRNNASRQSTAEWSWGGDYGKLGTTTFTRGSRGGGSIGRRPEESGVPSLSASLVSRREPESWMEIEKSGGSEIYGARIKGRPISTIGECRKAGEL
jgi:hypothetical protein